MTGMLSGQCHCGAVQMTVPRPDYINQCNCTLCSKLGTIWAYYSSDQVTLTGDTIAYVRADITQPALASHHCPRCGATTHWLPLGPGPYARMGVNARLLEDGALDGVEMRYPDGRSWDL